MDIAGLASLRWREKKYHWVFLELKQSNEKFGCGVFSVLFSFHSVRCRIAAEVLPLETARTDQALSVPRSGRSGTICGFIVIL